MTPAIAHIIRTWMFLLESTDLQTLLLFFNSVHSMFGMLVKCAGCRSETLSRHHTTSTVAFTFPDLSHLSRPPQHHPTPRPRYLFPISLRHPPDFLANHILYLSTLSAESTSMRKSRCANLAKCCGYRQRRY